MNDASFSLHVLFFGEPSPPPVQVRVSSRPAARFTSPQRHACRFLGLVVTGNAKPKLSASLKSPRTIASWRSPTRVLSRGSGQVVTGDRIWPSFQCCLVSTSFYFAL